MSPAKKRRVVRKHGEDFLDKVAAIKITLEDGTLQRFDFASELRVPLDPVRVEEEAAKAPARLAFWTYQTERCLARLRAQERTWEKLRGEAYIIQRRYVDEHTTDMPTEANIQARLDAHPELIPQKALLDDLRKQYGVLRSLRDALDHRAFVLRRLLARRQQPHDPS